MELYTIQLAKWRRAKELGIPLIDTTVKSGEEAFSPTWDMVSGHKQGTLTDEEYTALYKELMLKSIKRSPARWAELMKMDKVAIACYCGKGKFCHRHLLAEILEKLCRHNLITFVHLGELE